MNASSIVRESIAKERAKVMSFDHGGETRWPDTDPLDRGIIPNSQRKPKYSLKVNLFFGGLILLSMLTGVAVGWAVRR